MTARYLLRLDDACATMDRQKWHQMEALLDRLNIKPIVAVVPDNRDAALCCDAPDPNFWDKVRTWQTKGWTIAMHGYQHLMHETDNTLVLPFYRRSEFAGLTYEDQAKKIRASWQIFVENGVSPTVWIAPAHCFEWLTLKALAAETSIQIVSDGIARNNFFEAGFHWIPQQLWKLAEKRNGLWTVCLHPNSMTKSDFRSLCLSLEGNYASRVISINEVSFVNRRKSLSDVFFSLHFWGLHSARKWLHLAKTAVRGQH